MFVFQGNPEKLTDAHLQQIVSSLGELQTNGFATDEQFREIAEIMKAADAISDIRQPASFVLWP